MAYKKSSMCGGLRYNTADFKEIDGVLTEASATALSGDAFLAPQCGGISFDDGVFDIILVDGKAVVTTAGTTSSTGYLASNCSLLFDAEVFELGDDNEIKLI